MHVEATAGLEGLWQSACVLVKRVVSVADHESFLDDCLDLVVEIIGANKGLITLTDTSGASYAINARGSGRALNAYEREEISRTIIADAHKRNRSLRWQPETEGGTPSAVAFGIASALAAPIPSTRSVGGQDAPRGVLYLDFRDIRREISDYHLQFVDLAASLIAVVLDQAERLRVTQEDLRAALATRPGEGPLPTLEELLRPPSMAEIKKEVETALASKQPIVITGESGTGKTLLARAIGQAAGRGAFVRATLGSSDDLNTISSELFGHHVGSFSGALTARKGLVEFAAGGTLLLDEVLNLPMAAQQLLLDFTQFGTYRPLGHSAADPKHADVRIIAATNGSLETAVREGRFREDLYYRLASIKLAVPPLRERREDIPSLVLSQLRRSDPSRSWKLAPQTRRTLISPTLPWRGNIRQLEAAVQRATERALAEDPTATTLDPEHFGPRDLGIEGELAPISSPSATPSQSSPSVVDAQVEPSFSIDPDDLGASFERLGELRDQLATREREIFELALARHGNVVARAARELGMSRTSLVSRLNTYKIPHGKG